MREHNIIRKSQMPHILFDGFGLSKISPWLQQNNYENGWSKVKTPLFSEFDASEKSLLKETMAESMSAIELAYVAYREGLEAHADSIRLWLGSSDEAAINYARYLIDTIYEIFQKNETLITFVDMRKQKIPFKIVTYEATNKDDTFNHPNMLEKITRDHEWSAGGNIFCSVHQLFKATERQHVGSGMRFYVGPALLNKAIPMEIRARHLLYKLVQKSIKTLINDDRLIGSVLEHKSYDAEICKAIARSNSQMAFKHPGCWSFFLNSFKYPQYSAFEIAPWAL